MVDYDPIPEQVRELVRERVHAFEHIEILLHLRAEAPGAVQVDALSSALRISAALSEPALAHLVAHGLVSASSTPRAFQYAPTTATLDQAVGTLAVCYASSRAELFRLISSNAVERLRSGSLRIFAEAFCLRRKKKNG